MPRKSAGPDWPPYGVASVELTSDDLGTRALSGSAVATAQTEEKNEAMPYW